MILKPMAVQRLVFRSGRGSSRLCDQALRRRSAIEFQHDIRKKVWLAQHSANVLYWTTKGPEGKTPYHKVSWQAIHDTSDEVRRNVQIQESLT